MNVSSVAAPTGGEDAHASLAKVLRYVDADVVAPACVCMPMTRAAVGADGLVSDPAVRERNAQVLQTLLAHARRKVGPA